MAHKRGNSQEWYHEFQESLWLQGDDTGQEEARFVKRALRLRKGQSVLDAPCGAGRIAAHLAKAGCVVMGVDLQPVFIRQAKARFHREGLAGAFQVMDLRRLDFANQFHAVYNWQGSFGYFTDAENLDLLRRYDIALKPSGRLLIDQPNRENILRHFRSADQRGDVKMTTRWDSSTQRVETVWTFKGTGRTQSCKSSIRLYTFGQLRRLFSQAGLEIEAAYGDLNGSKFHQGCRRLHLVGRKL